MVGLNYVFVLIVNILFYFYFLKIYFLFFLAGEGANDKRRRGFDFFLIEG